MALTAPIHVIADEQRARVEAAAWSHFTAPRDGGEFFAAWLALLASRVDRARAALLLVADETQRSFGVAAAWPDPQRDMQHLGPAAEAALAQRRGLLLAPDGGALVPEQGAHVAYPVEVDGALCAAVVVELGGGSSSELQAVLRQLHWASAWLVDHFRARALALQRAESERLALLGTLTAHALQHTQLAPSALAVANELAGRLNCDRVSIGFESRGQVQPLVLSHTATFDGRSDLVRRLGEAMDECLDLGVPVSHPTSGDAALRAMAHAESARALQVDAMLSVPLLADGQALGVMTLERNAGPAFDAEAMRLARAAGVTLGPVWALQRLNSRSAWQRTTEALHAGRVALFGPRHPGLKLLVTATALLLALLLGVRIDQRISARTVVEGAKQLAAAAPFNGFVAEAFVRAGDTVREGQPMARLDDRDLKLERARWQAEREQLQRRFQVAMAAADRSAMGVFGAQVNQAEAQLALAEERLSRVVLNAPFDGVVVSGDLSQLIGSPVEMGQLLFEVAPLEGFRVVLQVDDRDIALLANGQAGELVLSSLPGRVLPFTVRSITPVATQRDGRNVFRVEAALDASAGERLRPGMEGVGKVTVGRDNLLSVWTRGARDWLRLAFWNWMP